jgi:hypothetical protein
MSKLTARELGKVNRQQLRTYFALYPGWISAVALASATGQHINTVHAHCRNLIRFGYLEEKLIWVDYQKSNSGRHVIHYRLAAAAVKSSHRR